MTANTREDRRRLLEEAPRIPVRVVTTQLPLADATRALLLLKQSRLAGTGVLMVAD